MYRPVHLSVASWPTSGLWHMDSMSLLCSFRIRLFSPIQIARGIMIEQLIRQEVVEAINRGCDCSFPPEFLRIGKLSCRSTFSQVTYRSTVVGTSSYTSTQLMRFIGEWVNSSTTICIGPFILDINTSCGVGVASFSDAECSSL